MEACQNVNLRLVGAQSAPTLTWLVCSIQLRPYDRVMYTVLIPFLQQLVQAPVPWNGAMDCLLEGFEAGMRWLGKRMTHCNKSVPLPFFLC